MKGLDELQSYINDWSARAFQRASGIQNSTGILSHLGEEYLELLDAHTGHDSCSEDRAGLREEAADMVILLCELASSYGFSLRKAVEDKMLINESRSWYRDGDGIIRHIK